MSRSYSEERIREIKEIYSLIKEIVEKRTEEFRTVIKRGNDREVFSEFAFCLLTPQSRAKICWKAILSMLKDGTLWNGNAKEIENHLFGVRFKYKKSEYIFEARERYMKNGKFHVKGIATILPPERVREWLVKNVKGMGMKEASHFLRNIGIGENLAILDRHILKNLKATKAIEELPDSLSVKEYLRIENKMREFSEYAGISMSHLDLVLWYKETGEVFK